MKHFSSRGSTPLELVATVVMLLLPVTPIALIANQIQHEIAAESIARNALRLAVLNSPEDPTRYVPQAVVSVSQSWQMNVSDYQVWCTSSCQLVSLEVHVGNAVAIHTMGVEP